MRSLLFGQWAKRCGLGLCLLALVGLVGCGGGKGSASGTVELNGKRVRKGTVTFTFNEVNQTKSTDITPEGTYSIDDLPIGEAVVTVISADSGPGGSRDGGPRDMSKMKDRMAKEMEQKKKDAESIKNDWGRITMDYGNVSKSTLKTNIGKGSNPFDIKMKS